MLKFFIWIEHDFMVCVKRFNTQFVVRDDHLSANKMTDNMAHGLITIYPSKW